MMQRLPAFDRAAGRWLRAQRLALEKSQAQMAGEVDLSFQQWQKYESGANRVPFIILVKMAIRYKFSLDALTAYLAPFLKERR